MRDLPEAQRLAWENLFQHYIFRADNTTSAHIPEKGRRALGVLDDNLVRELRANLLARLNR